jgi:hypothetical protein
MPRQSKLLDMNFQEWNAWSESFMQKTSPDHATNDDFRFLSAQPQWASFQDGPSRAAVHDCTFWKE